MAILPFSSKTTTAVTQLAGDSSTKIANTAFVQVAVRSTPGKEASEYATIAALPAIVYANGSSGVGATLTGVAVGALGVDSQSPAVGNRILVKNQVSIFQNGIYTVTATGSGIAVFVMTRALDFNQQTDVLTGAQTYVVGGTTLAGTTWDVNSADSPVIGTDAITFVQSAGIIPVKATAAELDTGTDDAKFATALAIAGRAEHDGWTPARESWAYASATTITVPSGAASKYQKGDKVKWTQTTVKYGVIVVVADTLLTIAGNTDYVVTNAAISVNYYSHQDNPLGFPSSFAYTVIIRGTTGSAGAFATDRGFSRFTTRGKMCRGWVSARLTNLGSWSADITVSVPIPVDTSVWTTGGYIACSGTICAASANPYTQAKGFPAFGVGASFTEVRFNNGMTASDLTFAGLAANDEMVIEFEYAF